MKTNDALNQPLDPRGLYYIQDTRQVVGNCVSWWAKDSNGYTCDLKEAGQYEGTFVQDLRETDVPWPIAYVLANTVVHVRIETLRRIAATAKEMTS